MLFPDSSASGWAHRRAGNRRGACWIPESGELVLVTREEILEHAEADGRVLEAVERYAEKRARWHGRLIRTLRPYGDGGTSVGEAVRRTAADLGIERDGRSFEEFAGLVVAAAEAQDGAAAG